MIVIEVSIPANTPASVLDRMPEQCSRRLEAGAWVITAETTVHMAELDAEWLLGQVFAAFGTGLPVWLDLFVGEREAQRSPDRSRVVSLADRRRHLRPVGGAA